MLNRNRYHLLFLFLAATGFFARAQTGLDREVIATRDVRTTLRTGRLLM